MIDPQKHIRKAIIDALSESVNRPIRIDGYRPLLLTWENLESQWSQAEDRYADQVEVYNVVPMDAIEPYIRVYSTGYNEVDFNRSKFNIESFVSVEVVTSFQSGVGGELEVNDIVSGVIKILRKRDPNYFDLSSNGLNIYRLVVENVSYIEDDDVDGTFYKAIIDLSITTEQN